MTIDYAEIGRRMAKRRKELGYKQYELCEMIGVNYKYISNLETGRSAPSLEVIMKLCDALQITPDYLLVGTASCNSSKGITDKINKLDSKNQMIISSIIDILKDNQ